MPESTLDIRPVEATPNQATAASPSNQASQAPQKPQRSILVDIVRGLAITLVALGHTNQGVAHRGWWGASLIGERIDSVIYAFHMPAFFFISGVFLCASLDKRGLRRFTLDKLRTMIWPYLFFCCLGEFLLQFLARFTVQRPLPLGEFLVALATGAESWFLPTIFFAVILAALLRRLPIPLFFAVSVLLSLWSPITPLVFVTRGLNFLPFLVVGMWVGRSFERLERIPVPAAAIASASILAVIILAAATRRTDNTWLFIPLGLLGTFMLLLIARVLGRAHAARTLAWIGEASFGIFLLAPFAQGIGRELLLRLHHITDPWLQLFFPTLLAVAIPAWIYQRRHRLRIAWTFHFPF